MYIEDEKFQTIVTILKGVLSSLNLLISLLELAEVEE